MKAIAVIDLPENTQIEDFRLDNVVVYHRPTQRGYKLQRELKLMPASLDWKFINETTNEDSFEYGRCCGRQELIDEIFGEQR